MPPPASLSYWYTGILYWAHLPFLLAFQPLTSLLLSSARVPCPPSSLNCDWWWKSPLSPPLFLFVSVIFSSFSFMLLLSTHSFSSFDLSPSSSSLPHLLPPLLFALLTLSHLYILLLLLVLFLLLHLLLFPSFQSLTFLSTIFIFS